MALNAPYTPNTVIQSTQVSNDLTGLANGSNDTATNSMSTYRSEGTFDFVASGCVWSGDSYGSTRNASMTSGVVYIAGVRLAVSTVTGRLFTASKDTYIDSNSSGVLVYTEVSNNAASPALAASSLRVGIIVTGATTIANSGSVNQGQETIVLPIASSIAYSVTDSLGNLICPRDPNRKILGFKQITSDFTATTIVQVTGLSCPVIVPTGRKVLVTLFTYKLSNSNANRAGEYSIWDGVVSSGSLLNKGINQSYQASAPISVTPPQLYTPSAGLHTFNASLVNDGAGTMTVSAASTSPAFILVELA